MAYMTYIIVGAYVYLSLGFIVAVITYHAVERSDVAKKVAVQNKTKPTHVAAAVALFGGLIWPVTLPSLSVLFLYGIIRGLYKRFIKKTVKKGS